MMDSQRPVIIGGGGHARSLAAMAPEAVRPVAYVDPVPGLPLEWLGNDEAFLANTEYADAPVIIGYVAPGSCSMATRRRIINRFKGRSFATIIAADATVEPDTVIGAGSMIFHRATVNTGVFLGDHVVVNTGAIVEHDTTVGSNTFIGPGAILAGGVTVGNDVYIGGGACLRNGITVCDGTVIGMGAVVVGDITEPGVYVGNPAKFLKAL